MNKVLLYFFLGIGVLALLACLFSSFTTSSVDNEENGTFFIVYDNVLKVIEKIGNILSKIGKFIINFIETIVDLSSSIIEWFEDIFGYTEDTSSHIELCSCINDSFFDLDKNCICDTCNKPFDYRKVPYNWLTDLCDLCGKNNIQHYHSFIPLKYGVGDVDVCNICGLPFDELRHHYGNCCN